MASLKVYYDAEGKTLTVWFGDPSKEHVAEETGDEVFVLDMGEPVKIVDLAKNMIRLSGKELGVDAEIVYTGLRPGEKLH